MTDKIIITVWRGMVENVEFPDAPRQYLVRDFDVEDAFSDHNSIHESQYPDFVVDVKGGMVVDVINNTPFDYIVVDNDWSKKHSYQKPRKTPRF